MRPPSSAPKDAFHNSERQLLSLSLSARGLLGSGHWTPAGAWESLPPLGHSNASTLGPPLYVHSGVRPLTQQTLLEYLPRAGRSSKPWQPIRRQGTALFRQHHAQTTNKTSTNCAECHPGKTDKGRSKITQCQGVSPKVRQPVFLFCL